MIICPLCGEPPNQIFVETMHGSDLGLLDWGPVNHLWGYTSMKFDLDGVFLDDLHHLRLTCDCDRRRPTTDHSWVALDPAPSGYIIQTEHNELEGWSRYLVIPDVLVWTITHGIAA